MINGYGIIKSIKKGLLDYLTAKGLENPKELKNKAIRNLTAHETLNKQQQVYPQIDDSSCIKCGKCVTICDESEHSALSLTNGHITVNKDACIGCSLCSHICPKSAIKMK